MQRTAEIRKMITSVEDIHREAGTNLAAPSRKCVIAAVITNPLAGAADGDLDILYRPVRNRIPNGFVCLMRSQGWPSRAAHMEMVIRLILWNITGWTMTHRAWRKPAYRQEEATRISRTFWSGTEMTTIRPGHTG